MERRSDQEIAEASGGEDVVVSTEPDERAERCFDHGRMVLREGAQSRALEAFIAGLRYDPTNLEAHQELRYMAVERFVTGQTLFPGAEPTDDALEQMLNAELAWSADPHSDERKHDFIAKVSEAEDQLGISLRMVIKWARDDA